MKTKSTIKVILLFFLWLASCNRNEEIPKNLIQPVEMSSILLDMQMANVYNNTYISDSGNRLQDRQHRIKVFYQQILMLHHTDTTTFLKSYRFYEKHPDLMKNLYSRMMDSITQKKSRHGAILEKQRKIRTQRLKASSDTIGSMEKFFLLQNAISDSIHHQSSRIFYPDFFN